MAGVAQRLGIPYHLAIDAKTAVSRRTTPASKYFTLPLTDLSPIFDKEIVARFDGGNVSSDGGLTVLREVERRTMLSARLAACLDDPRAPGRIQHSHAEMIAFRTFMVAAGYGDANGADTLRRDPVFKMALERRPCGADLCSQPTLSRREDLPDIRALIRMARTMVAVYCASLRGYSPQFCGVLVVEFTRADRVRMDA